MPRQTSIIAWIAICLGFGCGTITPPTGGQSGSENGPSKTMGGLAGKGGGIPPMVPLQQHCPCDMFQGQVPLLAAVNAVDQRSVRLRLVEVLAGQSELTAGAEFGGSFSGLCSSPNLTPDMLPVGSRVLAYFEPGDHAGGACCERLRCQRDSCTGLARPGEDNGGAEYDACNMRCASDTQIQCETHREEAQLHGRLRLAPWHEGIVDFIREGDAAWTQPASNLPLIFEGGAACKSQIADGIQWLIKLHEQQAPAAVDAPAASGGPTPPPGAQQPPPSAAPPSAATPLPAVPVNSMTANGAAPTPPPGLNPPAVAAGPPSNPDDPYNRCMLQ